MCQPRGRGSSTAVFSFSAYCFSPWVKVIVRRTASRRLICPSIIISQRGQLASSKSAMKVDAPQLSALITILRSVGPVISTRRSRRSFGCGAMLQLPSRMAFVSGRKSGSTPASKSFWRAARFASSSCRRDSKPRCSVATNASASGVRMVSNPGRTGPRISMPAGNCLLMDGLAYRLVEKKNITA